MTVVVGPNGSGKSNVADAIRWALGEQSAKQIRARKTEDVIFSGSERRRPMGMAEVTLTLDNSEGWMPIEFSEVAVTRRAHRSGENEYLINGQNVRLTDVLDLFRRAQVGQNSYAHMSQGLVDEVLALRPGERRELIEEAADVRRHRHQLTLSERRLSETRDNLGHVRMLIKEVEPRLRQLARQSKRAAEYKRLAGELSDVLQVYLETELRRAHEAQAAARASHDQRAQRFAEAQREMQTLESRLRDLEAALHARRAELERVQGHERELAEEGLRLEQSVALTQQRLELLGVRRGELEQAIAAGEADLGPDGGEGDDDAAVAAMLTALEAQVAGARTRLAREQEALASADSGARDLLRQLSELEARRARLEGARDDASRRIAEYTARTERLARERAEAEQRRDALLVRLREHGAAALAHERAARDLAEAAGTARRRREAAERRLEDERRAEAAAAEALREAEAQAARLRERLKLIEMLRDSVPAASGGAQALLEAAQDPEQRTDEETPLAGVIDAVHRLIRVPDGLEAAIEAALAEHIAAIVVEHEADAYSALEYLRREQAGTATVFPLDAVEHRYPLNLFNERGVIGVASRLVRAEQKYRPLIDTLLGRVIVVDDLKVAQQMVKRGLGSVVTKDGTLLRQGGGIFGGRAGAAAERFSLERELEALPAQIDEADLAVEPARARLERAAATVAEARAAVEETRRVVDDAEERRRAHGAEQAKLRQSQAALAGAMRAARVVLAGGGDEEAGLAEAREARERAQQQLIEALSQIDTLRDRSEAVGQERDAAVERSAQATQALAAVDAERRALVAQREERAEARRRARQQLEERRSQFDALRREQEDLELSLQDRRARLANHRTAREEAQRAVGPTHAAVAELEQENRELAATRRERQQALLSAERELLESENAAREAASRVQRLLEQVAEEGMEVLPDGRVHPLPVVRASADDAASDDDEDAADGDEDDDDEAQVFDAPRGPRLEQEDDGVEVELFEEALLVELPEPIRGGADVDTEELRGRINVLRSEIRALGPVNVDALEDLSEEQERHDYLTAQVADLEAAEVELRDAIRELKKLIRERFTETFALVNERFSEYFRRFFGGGQAELRLTDDGNPDEPEEDAEPGVEIMAQPPGKRVSSLNVLSGGERSMTSVALLFSLLSVNPAPMVVLDEVDAALDEANVGRFVDTLRELRDRTQFIVISHNRRTIEAGDSIYGVSMGEDSTSQVLSLRLADLPAA